MNLIKRITGSAEPAPLTELLEAHLEVVSGGATPGPGCAHVSTGCGDTHDSRTSCKREAEAIR